ncbi:hypothetical protein DPV79_23570 [Burkholderia reimsis]|uniref:Uncharacterized protein n=2 Tax=Burkholderia reimsis TaxID=2234132 RepID=A0A365QR11_9BURK|nr:hypothetical protein DPV79_23570 [Burkholderia reimsis]
MALLPSTASLGITVYGAMLRAGTVTEQIWTVAVSLVAALYMYLAPMFWRFARTRTRAALIVLWLLAAITVLRGQVDVLALANRHAADERAQTVAVVAVPTVATEPADRSVTAIEQDIAKVSIDLAHVEARHCAGECRALRIRKAELSARLAVLNAEAIEAKRRATERDWLRDQASRAEELRESRRAEPGTALIAPWLGTTEARLDVLMNFVLVVVVEGAACFGWYFVGLGVVSASRAAVASDRSATVSQWEAVVPMPEVTPAGRVEQCMTHVATVAKGERVASGVCPDPIMSKDDHQIAKIHEAVVAGRLERNLVSIRKFLGCAQSEASRLNRLYIERFGKARDPRIVPMS